MSKRRTAYWRDTAKRHTITPGSQALPDPHFQVFQFDKALDKSLGRHGELAGARTISAQAHGLVHGDKTLRAKVARLLDDVFETAAFRCR